MKLHSEFVRCSQSAARAADFARAHSPMVRRRIRAPRSCSVIDRPRVALKPELAEIAAGRGPEEVPPVVLVGCHRACAGLSTAARCRRSSKAGGPWSSCCTARAAPRTAAQIVEHRDSGRAGRVHRRRASTAAFTASARRPARARRNTTTPSRTRSRPARAIRSTTTPRGT